MPRQLSSTHHDQSQTKDRISKEWAQLKSPDDAAAYVKAQVDEGAEYIKLMHEDGHSLSQELTLPSRDLQMAVISAAHARGLMTVAHALSYDATKEILECGADGLAHTFLDKAILPELVKLYRERTAHCNPTLSCLGSLTAESMPLQAKFADDPLAKRLLSEEGREAYKQSLGIAAGAGTLANALDSVKVLHEAGVPILAGSDAAGPVLGVTYGLSMHQELHLFATECGMTPVAALQTATTLPARRFGMKDRGFIEEGLNADLVLCEGDVEEHLRNKGICFPIKGVWRNGVVADEWKDIMA